MMDNFDAPSDTITIVTSAEIFKDTDTLPVTLEVKYHKYGLGSVTCMLLIDGEQAPFENYYVLKNQRRYLQVRSRIDKHRQVLIPKLFVTGVANEHFRRRCFGIAELYIEGDLSHSQTSGELLRCYLTLPETALAIVPSDWTRADESNVKLFREPERTSIVWRTDLGKAELIRSYSYYPETKGVHRARVEVFEPQVEIDLEAVGDRSLQDLIELIESSQRDTFWILSFLGKKRLLWYSGAILSSPIAAPNQKYPVAEFRRHTNIEFASHEPSEREHPGELLIPPEKLRGEAFKDMAAEFDKSPHKSVIVRVIQNLLITHDDFFFEAHLGILYTALEILVNGISKDTAYIMDNHRFDKLKNKLKAVLNDEFANEAELLADVRDKLAELQRRSYRRRLQALFKQYNIVEATLWPQDTDPNEELKRMVRRRDDYIHEGKIADTRVSMQDFRRLRYLISILILRILKFPASNISEDEDQFMAQRTEKYFKDMESLF